MNKAFLDMITNLIVLLFGITFVGSSSLPTIPTSKYVPTCKYTVIDMDRSFDSICFLAIRKYSSGLNYYWNLLLDDDSLYVGGQ